MPTMQLAFGSDHAGYDLKMFLIQKAKAAGYGVTDCGAPDATNSVDYPDFAEKACKEVTEGRARFAVLVCGTGLGISMSANKIPGIRCGLCHSEFDGEMSRRHNDANAIAFGSRTTGSELASYIMRRFLETGFEAGRHGERVGKMMSLACGK